MSYTSNRPEASKRCFVSSKIESVILETKAKILDLELAWIFENCFPNTLDTTVELGELNGKPDTFIITGDIHAMWLRDSTAQIWPYLRYANEDQKLKQLILGAIYRQAECVRCDPYANAFNRDPIGGHWEKDLTDMKPELHERKWEIDSLCYVIRLAYGYWQQTKDLSFIDKCWLQMVRRILKTFKDQQRFDGEGPYKFQRETISASDTLPIKGAGYPVKPCGLIYSAFRPSDDACLFHFLIPSNFFAMTSLRQLAQLLSASGLGAELAVEALNMAGQIDCALKEEASVLHDTHGKIWAYEVDGFGSRLLMDDANIPSLLSLPYLGCCDRSDPVYKATRNFVLSADNPFYFKGRAGEGIGGPHAGMQLAWPMSVIMRALTSEDSEEIAQCLKQLKATHAGTGFMHEGVDVNDPKHFTRKWFAWVNTLFGELILKLADEQPELLGRQY